MDTKANSAPAPNSAMRDARKLVQAEKFDEAATLLRDQLSKQPHSIELHRELLKVLSQSGETDQAAEIAERLCNIAPSNPSFARAKAVLHLSRKDYSAASEAFSRSIALGLEDANILKLFSGASEKAGNLSDAVWAARRALELQPDNLGLKLRLGKLLLATGQRSDARALYEELTTEPSDSPVRTASSSDEQLKSQMAIVVQAFIKIDTLKDLCNSLLQCHSRDRFHLVFVVDSVVGSKRFSQRKSENEAVVNWINAFVVSNQTEFLSISVHLNQTNSGTCRTCRLAVDIGFQKADFVIFAEDDVVFSRDALDWFIECWRQPKWESPEIWAIAGESRFFDSRRVLPDKDLRKWGADYAAQIGCLNKFELGRWIPSSCFATSREKWSLFGHLRGQPNGDTDVGRACNALDKKVFFPIVARARDQGMQHASGYSVAVNGASKIKNVKNNYVMSSDVPGEISGVNIELFDGDLPALWALTVQLRRDDVPKSIKGKEGINSQLAGEPAGEGPATV